VFVESFNKIYFCINFGADDRDDIKLVGICQDGFHKCFISSLRGYSKFVIKVGETDRFNFFIFQLLEQGNQILFYVILFTCLPLADAEDCHTGKIKLKYLEVNNY
jgi:hypothetical protein